MTDDTDGQWQPVEQIDHHQHRDHRARESQVLSDDPQGPLRKPQGVGEIIEAVADQNQIRVLPDTIGQCTSLQLLSLTCNQLAYIPDSVSNCTVLTALHVSSNRFRQLPRCIDDLVGLRRLWAANNELIGLPTSLARLEHLFELQVPAAPALPRAFSCAPLG